MDIQAEKLEIMKLIQGTDNPNVLESIKNIFKSQSKTDFWETLSQEQKEDILEGIKDAENGDIIEYHEFIEKYKS